MPEPFSPLDSDTFAQGRPIDSSLDSKPLAHGRPLVRRPSATREEFAHELLAFIAGPLSSRRTISVAPTRVDAATPLFESGLIDSLGIIDLLAFVETKTGKRIPLRQIDMRHFGTVERIVQTFWPETGVIES